MGYETRIVLDSVGPNGARITSWELTMPRMVLAELNTHRLFSRNSASSRAIPTSKFVERVMNDPMLPKWWGKNQSGMQAREELDEATIEVVKAKWLEGRTQMVKLAEELNALGLHKQIANRVMEPWMFTTVLVTATNFLNWYGLRDHPDAQPEIAWVAGDMLRKIKESTPRKLPAGEWHLPFVEDENKLLRAGHSETEIHNICAGRCARLSYLTHDGKRDPQADIDLAAKLLSSGHMSPFEHAAQAQDEGEMKWSGNFRGWNQYRKTLKGESVFQNNPKRGEHFEIEGLVVSETLA